MEIGDYNPMADNEKLTISKIEAARSQLDTAIELWFRDGDPVSIHTLAAAAYQVVHDIKTHRGIEQELMYDSIVIKDEYRSLWINLVKKQQNFFKHADRDPNELVEFPLSANVLFMVMSLYGLEILGEKKSIPMRIFNTWLSLNEYSAIKKEYVAELKEKAKAFGISDFGIFRTIDKTMLFDVLKQRLSAE